MDLHKNMEKRGKRLIVVLGMHRSGTSTIARGLNAMGVSLGDKLIPPCEGDNEKGFWEDIDINSLNIEILKSINSDWHFLSAIKQREFDTIKQKGYLDRAIELIHNKTSHCDIFGFKDPRLSRLLPFWKEVFTYCQLDVSYVLAIRNPMSVVDSLKKRNGFDNEKSYLLWLGHVIHSLTGTIDGNRVLVDYDRLMEDPDREIKKIAECLNLKIDPHELETYKIDFLDKSLRHTLHNLNDLILDKTLPPLVREVYSTLLDISETGIIENVALSEKISKWENELERIDSALSLADKLYFQKTIADQSVIEQKIQISNLKQQLCKQEQLLTQKDEELRQKNEELNQKNEELNQKNEELNQKNEELNQKNEEIINIRASLSWRITSPLRFMQGYC